MREHDVVLPWQYTVLAFLWIGAALAGLLLFICTRPGFMPADVRAQVRPYPAGYLAITFIATPFLVLRGRAQVRKWRAEAAHYGEDSNSALGRKVEFDRSDGMNVGIITLLIGLLLTIASFVGFIGSGSLLTGLILCAVGIGAIIQHAARNR